MSAGQLTHTSGGELGLSAGAVGQHTYAWLLQVAWASIYHGGWIPRASVQREKEPGRSYAFYDLTSEVMGRRLYHTLFIDAITNVHPGSKEENLDSNSQRSM